MNKFLLSFSMITTISLSAQVSVTNYPTIQLTPITEAVNQRTYNSCSYEQEGNSFEQGFGSSTSFSTVLSDDFVVPDGECWYVNQLSTSFFTDNVSDMSAIEVTILNDNAGLPGTILHSYTAALSDITTTYSGSNFGFNINEHLINIATPFTLCGGTGGTNYWISFQVINTTAAFYWECTYLSIYGANSFSASSTSGPWTSLGVDQVFEVFHSTFTSLNQIECEGYEFTIGSNTYNTTGVYLDTLTSLGGCDSIIELDLTILNVDETVSQTGVQLTANDATATYQWLNCGTGFSELASQTNQSFTSPVTGSFAVEVTSTDGCVDTSACMLVDYTGLTESHSDLITLVPNPGNGTIQLMGMNQISGPISVTITSMTGQVISVFSKPINEIDFSAYSSGIYFVNILHENGLESIRFIKE
jgi:hypothetical protein